MGLLDFLWRREPSQAAQPEAPHADVSDGFAWFGLDSPDLAEFMRLGSNTQAGAAVNTAAALQNMAVFRCVDLIASTIGMLPLYMMRKLPDGGLEHAEDHPLYDLLLNKPNAWQTGSEFRSHMQFNALTEGNAYALIVQSVRRVIGLVPLDPWRVTPRQNADWTLTYRYERPTGGYMDYPATDILHIRGLSQNGILGISRTRVAREAIGLALQAEKAGARLFRNGIIGGGTLSYPKTLSDVAYNRLRASMEGRYAGADNAHKTMIVEEGGKYDPPATTGANAQMSETRKLQIEEIARAFGVPRPLLMMDDTSWGSGIEQLAILFKTFGIAPWFKSWEDAIRVSLLSSVERRTLYPDFDERELLRGSLADQSSFYSKALGAGGSAPWMTQNEVREDTGLGRRPDGDSLKNPMTEPRAPSPS